MLLLHKCNCVFLLLRSFINYLGDLLGEIVFFQTKMQLSAFSSSLNSSSGRKEARRSLAIQFRFQVLFCFYRKC